VHIEKDNVWTKTPCLLNYFSSPACFNRNEVRVAKRPARNVALRWIVIDD